MPYFGIPIRNGLPIGLGSVAGFGVQQFSPADLFSAGEQGAWYDPSDLSTLFTDSAGTTPVTAVEQFVGLMLDKSKGLVLGSELVTNGGPFTNTTGWTASASTLSVVSSALRVTENGVGVNPTVRQSFAVTAGRTYQIVINVTNLNMLNFQVWVGSAYNAADWLDSDSFTTTGTRTLVFRAGGATAFFEVVGTCTAGGTSEYFDIGTISVKELAGNHATQTNSAKRPKLAARYNLLTYTEQFDNAAWTKSNTTVAANSTTAPDGSSTADTLTAATTGNLRILRRQNAGLVANTAFTYAVYIKKNTTDWVALRFWDVGSGTAAWFNINTGVTGTVQTGCTASITDAGNGWYRCSITRTMAGSIAFNECDIMVSSADNSDAATAGDSIFLWGADLRPASQATGLIGPTYQRVVDAATYDTAGFLPYLEFNGLSWSMSTNSIDFSAVPTNKMTVWAGVRKLSDATEGCLYELSSNFGANNGSFAQFARGSVYPAGFDTPYRGTSSNTVPGFSAAAPTTRVNTTLYNIAAPSAVVRSNGAQVYSDTTSVGTGNFGNYPLYIGQRAGTSFPFNGWLTSLIVRGAQSTQSQIEATESWVAGKTGVSL